MLLSGLHTWRRLIRSRLSRSTAHSRRKVLHQRRSRFGFAAMVEVLEDRTLLSAGALDTSFSDDGKVTTNIGHPDPTADYGRNVVAYQSDGKMLVVGYSFQGGSTGTDFVVTRYTEGGELDSSFGVGGIVTIDFGSTDEAGYGVTIDSVGRILVSGFSYQGGSTGYDFAVARLNVDGTLDETFAGDGKQTIDFPLESGGEVIEEVSE